jgi:hypothetical protein
MKKRLFILSVIMAVTACNSDSLLEDTGKKLSENDVFKVNITISRTDAPSGATKAYAKRDFSNDDVVYIFFNGVAAPKYLEMRYNSATGEWTPAFRNKMTSSDLSGSGKMTAVYLPYGNTATVAASGSNFVFQDGSGNPLDYKGYFLEVEGADYTYGGGLLSGDLALYAPATVGNDKHIHFDVSGFTSDHNYDMYQANVKPILLESISSSGVVSATIGSKGGALTGYVDGEHLTFSGVLDESVVGTQADYMFRINDWSEFILYTRDAGSKTISGNVYIGIGDISATPWTADANGGFMDLGLSVKWAARNLGATNPWDYGDYYAWGETTPKYTGSAQANPPTWKGGQSAGYVWSNYVYGTSTTTLTKYCTKESDGKDGFTDGKTTLELTDDAARVVWGGAWRMPTSAEQDELRLSLCSSEMTTVSTINGCLFTSKVPGFRNRTIFLPAAGSRNGTNHNSVGSGGLYWSSSLNENNPSQAWRMSFVSGYGVMSTPTARHVGFSVRPVCE